MKTCTQCKLVKDLTCFGNAKKYKDGLRPECKACRKVYYDKNRSVILEKHKEYYQVNCERRKEYQRNYTASHKEENKTRCRDRRLKNPKYHSIYWSTNKAILSNKCRLKRLQNLELMRVKDKESRERHKERRNIQRINYRARSRNAPGSISVLTWKSLLSKYGSCCLRCGSSANLSIDHIIPLSKGGTNFPNNLQPLCRSCNSSKGTKTMDYRLFLGWEVSLGR